MSEADDTGVVLELPTGTDAPATARRFVTEHAADLPTRVRYDAQLLVSEIVTNAVVHGRPTITLRVSIDPPGIGVAVHDTGESLPGAPPDGVDPAAPSGRGLLIVQALATAWGITPSDPEPGKTVWFRLALPDG